MNSVKEMREASQHLDVVQACLTEQDQQIKILHERNKQMAARLKNANPARDERSSGKLIDEIDRIIEEQNEIIIQEQDEQIKALHKQIHHLAAEVVSMNRAIGSALAALQTGTALDVAAAIAILRKG